jgi:hypothetical protein
MTTQKFQDPENLQEELSLVSTFKTLEDVKNHIATIFPDWYVGMIPKYSDDYIILQDNWNNLCVEINTTTKSIIIIRDEEFMLPNHELSKLYCELFTRLGFCVRKSSDLITCTVCNNALPREHLYNLLKEKFTSQVPAVWSTKCTTCV